MLHACLDLKNTILDKLHYVLYFLTPAMHPRYLALIDEAGKLVKVSVELYVVMWDVCGCMCVYYCIAFL